MTQTNSDIARALDRLADLLEIEEANPFRVRGYRNAARTIDGLSHSIADMVAEGADLTEIYGIGDDLARKLRSLVETGRLPALEQAQKRVPVQVSELMAIEQLGPKRVKALYKALGVKSVADLEKAARAGRVRGLSGFGEKTERHILEGIERLRERHGRTRLSEAEQVVGPLVAYLEGASGVKRVAVAGSYRRRKETVGDLDILVTCRNSDPVMKRFTGYERVARVVSRGDTRSTVHLKSGLQVDLRVVPERSYGAALQYFTGSKAHNVALRAIAQDRGLKLNEYGVYRGDKWLAGRTEKSVYAQLDLPYIEPELREDRGEIKAARAGRLPRLVRLRDIRGDLHAHTTATDGHATLEQMARGARDRGYEYIAITDHSKRLAMAHGLDEKRLAAHVEAIDALNERLQGITVLKGIEVDILENGELDLPDRVLATLDICVCAVHYHWNLSRAAQTRRIKRAMANPHCHVLAHPSGRLINEREPYEVDMEALIAAAAEHGVIMELNAQPARLDLTDEYRRMAKDYAVKVAVSTDAHSVDNLDLMSFGIDQARRGWLEKGDVVNTLSLAALRRLLNKRGKRTA